jgi:DNA-binding NtrC family response regulator
LTGHKCAPYKSKKMAGAREAIIVVDDEPDTLELCQRVLRDGYDVLLAASGHEAQQKTAGREIALALVDQRMPGMTGLEFLLGFRTSHPLASCVAMTAHADLEDIVALINQGRVHGFVLKPWNNQQMRSIVDREVENARRARTIDELNTKIAREHRDMLALLRELDPSFDIPQSNDELKDAKNRLRQRVSNEIEKLFLENILESAENISEAARQAQINRTFLYRLLKRHGNNPPDAA